MVFGRHQLDCSAQSAPAPQIGFDTICRCRYSAASISLPSSSYSLERWLSASAGSPQGMRVSGLARVLIVDPESDTEEVLKAVFEPKGLQVDRVQDLDSPRHGSAVPCLLVIDDDGLPAKPSGTNEWGSVPRVIIGSARLLENTVGQRYLQKPFQYPELIRMIDQLLTERAA